MGSVVSINPANGSSVISGTDFTLFVLTTDQIWNLSLEVNGSEYTVCQSGSFYLERGMYAGVNTSGQHAYNIFIPGSDIGNGANEIWIGGIFLDDDALEETYTFYGVSYSKVSPPTNPHFASTLSRSTVRFSWGAGSKGNGGNNVTGYQVQYQVRAPEEAWPTTWTDIPSSPVTTTEIWADPPQTVGYYRRSRVRTLGSAGDGWHSDWVITTNTLRRKWDAFPAWTDATLTARTSMIRAVHLTELQTRVNTIRVFYGLGAYSFTTITARTSKVAKWAALIQEIRTAIDGITTSHESWNTLEAGKPRIAHITQLRSVIDNW